MDHFMKIGTSGVLKVYLESPGTVSISIREIGGSTARATMPTRTAAMFFKQLSDKLYDMEEI